MKLFNLVCPKCCKMNMYLDLEETGGVYECEHCKSVIKSEVYRLDLEEIPYFDLSKPIDHLRLINFYKKKELSEISFRRSHQ